ncbi:hypothetical protein TRVL_07458 [Trypanosoma vivax]|uniref:Uncharacterized protein n=1 Tax=Trypanosoma vivax (strain Y486) TaxID=1055687 RepID=G0U5G5_TRYVY|nr:hypothetical protein TRVL_07458 [Trypanosoma vivax]CCC51115.1 hypothetical protein, unlikely [Trypanosoma vivax Y486]
MSNQIRKPAHGGTVSAYFQRTAAQSQDTTRGNSVFGHPFGKYLGQKEQKQPNIALSNTRWRSNANSVSSKARSPASLYGEGPARLFATRTRRRRLKPATPDQCGGFCEKR